jgi:hypothetical protein
MVWNFVPRLLKLLVLLSMPAWPPALVLLMLWVLNGLN